ncbi:MAG: hypothetical protein CML56_08675 [Rhodobacteraceae bacterium]|nr:hypothetical protein [Paracoccaceae bacterium]|tara:strand:- start:79 stop:375 length:297 start_codon:yes stop_codon:yes gene_type:complete
MKVKDLKIGMMLTVDSSEMQFKRVYSGEWLAVVHRNPRLDRQYPGKRSFDSNKIAMYIGRKKDIGETTIEWSDRFVLFDNTVLAVDPPAWRYIQELEK